MNRLNGIKQDKLKLHFLRPEGEVSRRQLLKLAVPRFQAVPYIDVASCQGAEACGLCLTACPVKAMKADNSTAMVDTALCQGCGACVNACPERAIIYNGYSPEDLDKQITALLSKQDSLQTRLIAFACQNCSTGLDEDEPASHYPDNIPLLKIPCLAMVSPWLMLRAFERGADNVVLAPERRECTGISSGIWEENVRFVQVLMPCWHLEPERLAIFKGDAGSFNEILKLGKRNFVPSELSPLPAKGLVLPAVIQSLAERPGAPEQIIKSSAVPFGRLELNSDGCSGCSLCAVDCPTGALVTEATGQADGFRLLFKHSRCVACGRCVSVCPEQCLTLEKLLDLKRLNGADVLLEDKVVRCRECGRAMATARMLDRLQVKLQKTGGMLASQLELCPECKMKQSSLNQRNAEAIWIRC